MKLSLYRKFMKGKTKEERKQLLQIIAYLQAGMGWPF